MRIKFVVPFPVDQEGIHNRELQIPPDMRLPGSSVEFVAVKNSGAWGDSAHDNLLMDFFVYEEGMRAEREGYDAVCVDTVSDAALMALRSRLSIPVVGPGQTSFHLASLLGNRFSIVTMWEKWSHSYRKLLKEYGLEDQCASIRYPRIVPDIRNLLGGKEHEVFPALEGCARECIDQDGADVIVLGSTTMYQAHRYLADRLPVPVINPGLAAFKLAEMLVDLKLTHSKKAYSPPLEPRDEVFERAANAVNVRPATTATSRKA